VALFEKEPTDRAALLRADSRRQWVLTGQALERTLLTATVRGLATTLMTQPLEIPHLRDLLTDPGSGWCRRRSCGSATDRPARHAPPRPLEEVVEGLDRA
jgi:hypothetical protein